MAKNDYLILFSEIEDATRKLNDQQFGSLIRAVMAYRFHGQVYSGSDMRVETCFDFMAKQVDREREERMRRSKSAEARWDRIRKQNVSEGDLQESSASQPQKVKRSNDVYSVDMITNEDAPIQSNPIQSNPIQSNPVQSNPVQNVNSLSDEREYRRGGAGSPPGKAKKEKFGKFGRVKLTPEEYAALEQELGTGELRRCIDYVDECAQATNNRNKWKDYSVILTRCSREGWGVQQEKRAQEIPKGASGVLGEAELEAIQLLLKEDNYAGTP